MASKRKLGVVEITTGSTIAGSPIGGTGSANESSDLSALTTPRLIWHLDATCAYDGNMAMAAWTAEEATTGSRDPGDQIQTTAPLGLRFDNGAALSTNALASGYPGVVLDGTDDYGGYFGSNTIPGVLGRTKGELWAVVRTNASVNFASSDKGIWAFHRTGGGYILLYVEQTTGKLAVRDGTNTVVSDLVLAAGTGYVVRFTADNAASGWKLYLNDAQGTLTVTGTNTGKWTGYIRDAGAGGATAIIMSREVLSLANYWHGAFHEFRIYDRLLTADQATGLNDALASKWGL